MGFLDVWWCSSHNLSFLVANSAHPCHIIFLTDVAILTFLNALEVVRQPLREVSWMEVRILGIYHPDHQDNLVLHYHDYHESHLVTSCQKEVLEALSHHQAFHEENVASLIQSFTKICSCWGFCPWTAWE